MNDPEDGATISLRTQPSSQTANDTNNSAADAVTEMTTRNDKRKREKDGERNTTTTTTTTTNNNKVETIHEEEAATEDTGHHLNSDADVPLPQLQAVNRDDDDDTGDDDDDDNDNEEEEEEEGETEEGNDDDDDDDDEVTDSSSEEEEGEEEEEPSIPTPEEVELEYTYPNDFVGKRWKDVVRRDAVTGRYHYFRLIIDPSCTEIAKNFFSDCSSLIEVIFRGNKLTRIRPDAFCHCTNLQRMNAFPKNIRYLEDSAFRHCKCLEIHQLVIPNSCVLVGEDSFGGCFRIKSVVFEESSSPEHILKIRPFAFYECIELRSVRLPKHLRSIPAHCFALCRALTDIPLPQSVQEIRQYSFRSCINLTSIDLSENINRLGGAAYLHCTSLESVTIRCASSSNIQIGPNVFKACTALSTIRMFPWLYPKLFQSMQSHPRDFLYKFVREYQHQLEQYRVQSRR